jgi:hypothetical protein
LDKKQNTLILPVCTGDIKKVGSFDSWKQCETPVMPTMIQSQNRFLVQSSSFFEFKSPLMFLELAAKTKAVQHFHSHCTKTKCVAQWSK